MIPVLNNPTTRLDLMVAIFFFDDGFQIIDSFTIEKEQEKYGSSIFFSLKYIWTFPAFYNNIYFNLVCV